MILEVQKKQATPEIVVLELRGRLLMGNDSRQVEWSIAEVMKEGGKRVVMDLRELDAIDSTGVGILVMCNAKLQKAGGVMRIVSTDGIVAPRSVTPGNDQVLSHRVESNSYYNLTREA